MAYVAPAVNEYWKIAFADESVYKTPEAIATVNRWIGILDEDQELPIPDPEYEQYYGGGNAKPFMTVEGKRLYDGKLKWKVQNGQLFENMFGKVADVFVDPEYTHTYSAGTADARPLKSIDLAYWFDKTGNGGTPGTDDIFGLASGVKMNGGRFSFEQGQALMCESDIHAVLAADQSGTFPTQTPISTKPYMMKELGSITAHGLTLARIISGNFSFKQGLEVFHYGQVDPYEHIEGRMTFDASLTFVIQDDDFWDFALAKPTASTNIDFTFTRTAVNDLLNFTLTNAYPKYKIKKGAERELLVEIPYVFEDIGAVVTDLNATYPL